VLTRRQQEIWDFLVDYVDRHGYPPTVREIGDAVGLASPSTVHAHLANLERAGLLKRDPTKPRALDLSGRREPVKREETQRGLPLVGEIAAGGPLLAEDNVDHATRKLDKRQGWRGPEARLDDAAFIAHFAGRRIDPSLPGSLAGALRMYGA